MQVISNSQNIGYMIPITIVEHFLEDLKDGNYNGFPILGIEFHNTENKSLREYYKVNKTEGGVLVANVLPFSSADGIIKKGDVVFEIEQIPIGMDGTFEFRENERLILSQLINDKQIGDSIKLRAVRNGKIIQQNITFNQYVGLVPNLRHFNKPRYYIYGGFVFTVLSSDLLKSWGKKWWEKAPLEFLNYLMGRLRLNENRKEEIVVLLNVLPDDTNIGYHTYSNEVILKFNGKEFSSFKDFVKMVEDNKSPYSIFETGEKINIVVKNENIPSLTQKILDRNNIPARYSDDVAVWIGKKTNN